MKNLLNSQSCAPIRSRSPRRESRIGKRIAQGLVIGIASAVACSPALGAAPDSDELAQAQWREGITKIEAPGSGCFEAAYPSNMWNQVECATVSAPAHPVRRVSHPGEAETTGNGNDYVLTGGLIRQTIGSFPTVSNVTSEKSVGVAAFGGGGILGANEYSLQLNTNYNSSTAACSGGAAGCTVWQQFIYATDYAAKGSAAVFMQYWLIGWGNARCPAGYGKSGTDCYKNSSYVSAPDVAATSLGNLKLTAAVIAGGNDSVTFANGTKAYTVSAADKVLDIATVWEETEFNVVGDAGGSEAVFNTGAAITVNVAATFMGSATAKCAANSGSTGETNNLNLGACNATGTAIQFTESLPK